MSGNGPNNGLWKTRGLRPSPETGMGPVVKNQEVIEP